MPGWRRRFASIEAAALAGIVCAVGWSVSFRGLLAGPGITASPAEIARHYAAANTGIDALVLLQIATLATIGFMWFIGVVRSRLGDAAPALTSTVFIGAGILTAGLIITGLAALAAPAVVVEAGGKLPDPGEVSITRAIAVTLLVGLRPSSRDAGDAFDRSARAGDPRPAPMARHPHICCRHCRVSERDDQ